MPTKRWALKPLGWKVGLGSNHFKSEKIALIEQEVELSKFLLLETLTDRGVEGKKKFAS